MTFATSVFKETIEESGTDKEEDQKNSNGPEDTKGLPYALRGVFPSQLGIVYMAPDRAVD